jgi:hypothetical protein
MAQLTLFYIKRWKFSRNIEVRGKIEKTEDREKWE